jgi:hypothetical protein
MADFIPPLQMETWLMSVFSGTPEVFTALALLVLSGMAGYFRMSMMTMFLMLAIFLMMFAGWVSSPILLLIAVIGGLMFGYTISKIFG